MGRSWRISTHELAVATLVAFAGAFTVGAAASLGGGSERTSENVETALCRASLERVARGAPPAPLLSLDPGGVMLGGFDPVSYFSGSAPQAGARDLEARYQGARYLFATAENRRAFLAAPQRYAPGFGGHDANGVRKAERRAADPEVYRIVEGRLVVFRSRVDLAEWASDERLNLAVADTIWPSLTMLLQQ